METRALAELEPPEIFIRERVLSWRRELFRKEASLRSLEALCGWLPFPALPAAWDRIAPLPIWGLWAFWAAAAAALLWRLLALARALRTFWRSSEPAVAAAVRRFPDLGAYLPSAWELLGKISPPGTSGSFRTMHMGQTRRILEILPPGPLAPAFFGRRMIRPAAIGLLSVSALLFSARGPSLARALAPWSTPTLESLLRVSPGSIRVNRGSPVKISASWAPGSSVAQDAAKLKLWIFQDGSWARREWDEAGMLGASFLMASAGAPFSYRLSWRGIESRGYGVSVLPVPAFVSVHASYLRGGREHSLELGPAEPLSVPRGSTVTLRGSPEGRVARAAIVFKGAPPRPMMRLASGKFQGSFPAERNVAFSLEVMTPDGRTDPSPPIYELKALADLPPSIEVLWPREAVAADKSETLSLSYEAKDDWGLERVDFLFAPKGSGAPAWRTMPAQRFAGEARTSALGEFTLRLRSLPRGPLRFKFRAVDDSGQIGFSPEGSLDILNFRSRHAAALKSLDSAVRALEAIPSSIQPLNAALASRAPQAKTEPTPQWNRFLQSLDSADSALQALPRALSEDPFTSPLLREQARSLGSEFADSARSARRSPPANAGARERLSSQILPRLGELSRRAARILESGRSMERFSDWRADLDDLSRQGRGLSRSLKALAGKPSQGGKPELPDEIRRLLSDIQKRMAELAKALLSLPQAPSQASAQGAASVPLGKALEQAGRLSQALSSGDLKQAAALAEELSRTLDALARDLGSLEESSPANRAAQSALKEMEALRSLWAESVNLQSAALGRVRPLYETRVRDLLKAQERLLSELAREQKQLVSSAAALGFGLPSESLPLMSEALSEFESRRITRAPELLAAAVAGLRFWAARRPPAPRAALNRLAAGEDGILRRLNAGPSVPPEPPSPASDGARRGQESANSSIGGLKDRLDRLNRLSPWPVFQGGDQAAAALAQGQKAGESLSVPDAAKALASEEAALSLLQKGAREFNRSAQSAGQALRGFGPSPQGGRPAMLIFSRSPTGMLEGPVRLPREKDYSPPRQLRRELERSMSEPRPPSYGRIIRSYFERLAR